MNLSDTRAKLSLLALLGACLFVAGGSAQAVGVTAVPNQPVVLDLDDPNDADDTGIKILNQDTTAFDVNIDLLTGDPILDLPTPAGFVLLDTTLRVQSTNPDGKRRIRVRMDFGRFLREERLNGIRADSIRLLRANERFSRRWLPAVQRINQQRIADIRYLRVLEDDDFVLGHHGIDLKRQFAWAITDTGGATQYFAIGGVAVPLPAAWLLFLSGSGLLLMLSRNRRKPVAAQ